MASLSLSLTGVASNWYVPQSLIEVAFAQGVLLGDPSTPKVLLFAPKRSTGTATVETVYGPIGSEAEIVTLTGAGSPIHRQYKAFTQVCKTAPIYIVCPAESGGTAASDTVTLATTATAAGTLSYTVCGRTVQVAISTGDAYDTVIAEALKNAINADTSLPVAATRSNGVVTVTAKVKGTNGNWVRHRASITGTGVGTTVTVANAVLQSGATDETYTTSLAAILATKFDYILPGVNPTSTSDARFAALSAQVQAQALPTTGIRQQVIAATAESLSNATTFVTAYNKARNQVLLQVASEWEPMEVAAQFAGVRYNLETGNDPGASYDNYGTGVNDLWFVPAAYASSSDLTAVQQNTAISVGLTPVAAGLARKSYVVMSVTGAGADPRVRDTAKVTVADRFAADLAARYASQWPRAKVADDQADGAKPYPAIVATPARVKANTIVPLLRDYQDRSLVIEVDGTTGSVASTAVGVDPVVTTRINARVPIKVTPLLHQFAALVSEVSSG